MVSEVPSVLSYLAALFGLAALLFTVFALLPANKDFERGLAVGAVAFVVLSSVIGFLDQADEFAEAKDNAALLTSLGAVFLALLLIGIVLRLRALRRHAELGRVGSQSQVSQHGNDK